MSKDSENDAGAGAIKQRLMSLYVSSSPQPFTQLLLDYDDASRQISAESARVYDLRAAARLQILFADGFQPAAAVRFLQEAIRHIETYGLPPAGDPAFLPDGSAASRRPADPPHDSEYARAEPQQAAAASSRTR